MFFFLFCLFVFDSTNLKTFTVGCLWIIKGELGHGWTELCALWMQHFILSLLHLSGGQRMALQCTQYSEMALQVNILYKGILEVDHNFSTLLNFPDRTRNTVPKSGSQQHLTFTFRLPLCFPEVIRCLHYLLFLRSHLFWTVGTQ